MLEAYKSAHEDGLADLVAKLDNDDLSKATNAFNETRSLLAHHHLSFTKITGPLCSDRGCLISVAWIDWFRDMDSRDQGEADQAFQCLYRAVHEDRKRFSDILFAIDRALLGKSFEAERNEITDQTRRLSHLLQQLMAWQKKARYLDSRLTEVLRTVMPLRLENALFRRENIKLRRKLIALNIPPCDEEPAEPTATLGSILPRFERSFRGEGTAGY